MVISIIIFLKEDSSSGDKRSVGGDSKLLLGVRITKDRGGTEGFFDLAEGFLLRL